MVHSGKARRVQGGLSVFGAVFLVPLLLAPVYYQGEAAPTVSQQGTPVPLTGLPSAVPLSSPLLVTPTFQAEPAAGPETPPASPPEPEPPPAPRLMDAAACARGLSVMQDMAALGYQREPNGTYMGVLVAAGMAKQQVTEGQFPNLQALRNRIHAISWRGALKDPLIQAYTILEIPCTPMKGAGKRVNKPGVARPD